MKTVRLPAALLAAAAGANLLCAAPPPENIRSALPPPEFYVQQRHALNLSDEQGRALRAALATMKNELRAAEAETAARVLELQTALEDPAQPPAEVTRRFDALLQAENRIKTVRFRTSLAARRLLTADQWAQIRPRTEPAGSPARTPAPARSGPAANFTEDERVPLRLKMENLRVLALEVFPGGPPPDFRRRAGELRRLVQAGRTADAARLFDSLIADLEARRPAPPSLPPKP